MYPDRSLFVDDVSVTAASAEEGVISHSLSDSMAVEEPYVTNNSQCM